MAAAVDKAYLAIRDGIVRGRFSPGSHLTAHDLASASGLSRTPVREAMRRLHAEGLIEFIPHRGAFVTRIDESEINNIYDLRVALESYAAEAAARNITPSQLEDLRSLATQMRDLIVERPPEFTETLAEMNNHFHKQIVVASHNPRLQSALSSIVEMPLVLRTFRGRNLDQLRRSNDQHLELVSALAQRDCAWARSVMTSHTLSAQHMLLRTIAAERESEKVEIVNP